MEIGEEKREMVSGPWGNTARCLHAQHFRHLLQDPYCPWHGPCLPSLQCPRQTSRPPRWYVCTSPVRSFTTLTYILALCVVLLACCLGHLI